jgi:hypothetical protein
MNDLTAFYPPLKKTTEINRFKIVDVKINLFESASFNVLLFDINGNLADNQAYTLTTEEYIQWYNDDLWLIKWVKTKLTTETL